MSLDEIIEKIGNMDLENIINVRTYTDNYGKKDLYDFKFYDGKDIVKISFSQLYRKLKDMTEENFLNFKKKYIEMYEIVLNREGLYEKYIHGEAEAGYEEEFYGKYLYDKIMEKISFVDYPESIKKIKKTIYGKEMTDKNDTIRIYHIIARFIFSINEDLKEKIKRLKKPLKYKDKTVKKLKYESYKDDYLRHPERIKELVEDAENIYTYVKDIINNNKAIVFIEYILNCDYQNIGYYLSENNSKMSKANLNGLIEILVMVDGINERVKEHYNTFIELRKKFNYLRRLKPIESRISIRNKK
jgi:hypothetical protein